MPSTQGLERELQETAAMLECTDSQFLPPAILEKMTAEGGRGKLQERLTALKQIDREFEAVSASLQVPFYRTFARVTVPICMPAILDIAVMHRARLFGEFVADILEIVFDVLAHRGEKLLALFRRRGRAFAIGAGHGRRDDRRRARHCHESPSIDVVVPT